MSFTPGDRATTTPSRSERSTARAGSGRIAGGTARLGPSAVFRKRRASRSSILTPTASARREGDAPDFVEVGEAGIAVGDAMRRGRCVQQKA